MEINKFQWSRVDEIIIFIVALAFLALMAHMQMPSTAIMTMAGSLITIVPIYIKSALERKNGNRNENGNDVDLVLPTPLPKVTDTPPVPLVKQVLKYHLRDEGE